MLTDVVADAVTADVDVVSEITVVSGLFFCSSAVADVAMAAVVMVAVVTTAACGSSYYSSAVVDLEMVAVMDADVDAVMTVAKP